jgi:shikimate dehydrogenase
MAQRAGVLGKPIGHSLSPVIHNAGYRAAGLTGWRYSAHECAEAELPRFVAALEPEWIGLSLTMPLKEAALAVAEEVTPLAATLGAANTLVRRAAGGWRAENTDAPGMVEALRTAGVRAVEQMAVLGAGGTARAALAAAQELGAATVTVYARRAEAIEELAEVAEGLGVDLLGADWDEATKAGEADIVVATTPKGAADVLELHWRGDGVLFDALYDPWPTPLAAAAAAAGCRVISGLDLLLAQAAHQFELFTGVPAPRPAMRAALDAAVTARGR